jgi:hypothetical protein
MHAPSALKLPKTPTRLPEDPIFKYGDQVGEPVHHLLAASKLGGLVEVRHVGQLVGICQRRDDPLVDLISDVTLALECDHVFEARAFRNGNRCKRLAGIFVADVFDEQQDQDVVLVRLASMPPRSSSQLDHREE